MSRGVTSSLFFAWVVEGSMLVMNGTIKSAMITAWAARAIAWVQPKFSSLDQISFTWTGLIPAGITARVGEKNSFNCSTKPPKLPPQSTSSRLSTGVLRTLGPERKNFRFSRRPEPKEFLVKGTSVRSMILTGRSRRNCFRLDQKSSGIRCAGVPKSGSALLGTGITSSGPERFGLLSSFGRRLIKPGTVIPSSNVDANPRHKVYLSPYDSRRLGKVARPLG